MRRRSDFVRFEDFVVYSLEKLMAQIDDLSAAVTKLQADVTTLTTGVAAEVTVLNAEIATLQAGNPTLDLSGIITSVNNIDAAVTAATPAPVPTPAT